MNLDAVLCGDIETDGFIEEVTKIHVFSCAQKKEDWIVGSTNRTEDIKKFFINPNNVIAIHNGHRYDGPVIEKLLGIKIQATIIDTLALAWYSDHGRAWNEYNLEWYGELFGVPKPPVADFTTLTYEGAKHRCEEDVKITIKLWEKLLGKLRQIYNNDADIVRIIKYLNFIMECSYHQERQKIEVDLEKTNANLAYFEGLKEAKMVQLKQAMPKVPIKSVRKKPKEFFKKDGSLSVAGKKWMDYDTDKEEVEIITGYQEPNPNSVPQKKAWLYSLGWKPQTFSYTKDKVTGKAKKIEQILTEEKELCPSVKKLINKDPAIEVLDGISVLSHRIGLFNSFLDRHKNGFIVQGLTQLAVTLRWQHSVIVNLPKVSGKGDIRDGKWIRECLIAGTGKKIVQSDLSGIESRTSDHYTFPINPELIKETSQPYFDPHTKVAVISGLMSRDEETWYKIKKNVDVPPETFGSPSPDFVAGDEKKLMDKLKLARHKAKTTNYSCLYGVGAKRLSLQLDIPNKEAQDLIDAYWRINFAVKEVSKTFTIKQVGSELWILNPISKFWHHLRNEKDSFSTVNQSSAVYCFNIWLYNITRSGLWPICQSHDDGVWRVDEENAERAKAVITKAMETLNKQLKLNIQLDCEVQVGDNISQTH